MNRLSTEKRAAMIAALVEGNSVRATARMTDVAYNTVLKFVVDIGTVCREYLDDHMRNLPCRRLHSAASVAASVDFRLSFKRPYVTHV